MNIFFVVLVLCIISHSAYSEKIDISVDILNQFFQKKHGTLDKLYFDLNDLEEIFTQIQPVDDSFAQDITKKYLNICYPKGEISVFNVLNSSIPRASKEIILSSEQEKILLEASFDDLWNIPLHDLSLMNLQKLNISRSNIDANNIIQRTKQYTHNLHYGSNIQITDSKKRDYLSSTASEKHLVSEVMRKTKGIPLQIQFRNHHCDKKKCYSENSEGYFSSFQFPRIQQSYIGKNQKITAQCQYENIYRREYIDTMEVEIAFSDCQIDTENSKSHTNIHPVLKRIYPHE